MSTGLPLVVGGLLDIVAAPTTSVVFEDLSGWALKLCAFSLFWQARSSCVSKAQ